MTAAPARKSSRPIEIPARRKAEERTGGVEPIPSPILLFHHEDDTGWARWMLAFFESFGIDAVSMRYDEKSYSRGVFSCVALISDHVRDTEIQKFLKARLALTPQASTTILATTDYSRRRFDSAPFPTIDLSGLTETEAIVALADVFTASGDDLLAKAMDGLAPPYPGANLRRPKPPREVPPEFRILVGAQKDLLRLVARLGLNDPSARGALERPETLTRQGVRALAGLVDPASLVALDRRLESETAGFQPSPLWTNWVIRFHGAVVTRFQRELESLATTPESELP